MYDGVVRFEIDIDMRLLCTVCAPMEYNCNCLLVQTLPIERVGNMAYLSDLMLVEGTQMYVLSS